MWNEWDDFGASDNLFGKVGFTNRFTGNPYADFLLGIPTLTRAAPVESRSRWSMTSPRTDDFKLWPKLTLNLGVRYELHLNWREPGRCLYSTSRQASSSSRMAPLYV
jgi:hypothetical protein